VVRKQSSSARYESGGGIASRQADKETAGALFARAAAFVAKNPTPPGGAADENDLYFYDGAKLQVYSAAKVSPPEFFALFGAMGAAFGKADAAPDFYVHCYYAAPSGTTTDVHIFSDGAVVLSAFDRKTYALAGTSVLSSDTAELAAVRRLAARALKAPAAPHKDCAAYTGLVYGFVEIESDGGFVKSYTCGTENNDIAVLFTHIRMTYGG